jgi:ribosomal protein S19E (S16A)
LAVEGSTRQEISTVDAHQKAKTAITEELLRQAEEDGLNVETDGSDALDLDGRIDLDALAAAVVGAVAGGP